MKEINKGILKNGQNFEIRELEESDIEDIEAVQNAALHVLDSADTLQPVSRNELKYNLTEHGYMIGAFVSNQLIAFRSLLIPKLDEHHLGFDLGLDEQDFDKVVYQEITVVHPEYRGNGLQQILGQHIMKSWERLNRNDLQYVCATVAPHNIASIKDKFKQNLEIIALKHKYHGKLRYIFLKDLAEITPPSYHDIQDVEITDERKQRMLLEDGWKGYRLNKNDEGFTITFGK